MLDEVIEGAEIEQYIENSRHVFKSIYSKEFQSMIDFLAHEDMVRKDNMDETITQIKKILDKKRVGVCAMALSYLLVDVFASEKEAYKMLHNVFSYVQKKKSSDENVAYR